MASWDDTQKGDAKGLGYEDVKKEKMNKLVMNYFVTEGYVDAAREFEKESGTRTEVDLDTIKDRMLIRRAVQKGEVEDAIDRVNDLNPEILEHDSKLFFHLQQQRLIELIRQKEVDKALLFAQEYLAPLGEENPGESRPPVQGRVSRRSPPPLGAKDDSL